MRLEKIMVSSCEFVVSSRKKAVLEAWLGSCVGVVLYDRQAAVGGLLHILLPEPTGASLYFEPETYASTGLPLFIQTLCEAGASPERLEAHVAGGALVAPVSEQDLNLNIGGRIAETVQSTLAKAAIPINRLEIGGFFSCKISLNLTDWSVEITPLWQEATTGKQGWHKLTPVEIDKAIEVVRPIPQIALKIMRMIQAADYNMADIAAEVLQDQIISGNVLALCNSALIGLRSRVDSVHRALTILGEKIFLRMAMAAFMETMFPKSGHGYSLCMGGIFMHALGNAMIAHELAIFSGKIAPEVAYTAGLLHDIGKIPLDQHVASFAPHFYRNASQSGIEALTMEEEKFGTDHTRVGRLLAEKWGLPANLIDTIRHHHQPERAEVDQDLVALIHLADLLMSRFQAGHDLDWIDSGRLPFYLQQLGLKPGQLPIVVDRLAKTVFKGLKCQPVGQGQPAGT